MSLLKNEKKSHELDSVEQEIVNDFDEEIKRQDKKGYEVKVKISPLNVRSEPSLSGALIDVLSKGERKTIIEDKDGWGKLKDGGWILLDYVEK